MKNELLILKIMQQENQEGERMTKGEISCRSQSSARRSRAAAIHNLSERVLYIFLIIFYYKKLLDLLNL